MVVGFTIMFGSLLLKNYRIYSLISVIEVLVQLRSCAIYCVCLSSYKCASVWCCSRCCYNLQVLDQTFDT